MRAEYLRRARSTAVLVAALVAALAGPQRGLAAPAQALSDDEADVAADVACDMPADMPASKPAGGAPGVKPGPAAAGTATVPIPPATSPGALVAPNSGAVPPGEAPTQVDRARPVAWTLEIDAPGDLRKLLLSYLDLARFQQEAARDATLAIRRSELRRLVVSAPEQAKALLAGAGYFNPKITTRVGDERPGQPVLVHIHVDPGPLTRVSQVQFVFEGELDSRLSANDPLAQALEDRLESEWALPEGEVFRQATWSSAKNAALARIRADGYPTASWSGTSVTVDAESNAASLYLIVDSGPGFTFGDVRIEGLVKQPASAITNLAPFGKGSAYSEKHLLDWQERIQKLNLFDNVFVATDLDPKQAGAAPVVVQVHELPLQTATTGIGISTDSGPRVSLEHLHRNVFDMDWQAKTKLQLGRQESIGSLDLTSHPWPRRRRGLISAQASRLLDSEDSVTTSQQLRVGLLHEGERLERTDYAELQSARVVSEEKVLLSKATALSGTSQWIYRDVDSQTQPTKGFTALGQGTVGRSYATLAESGLFSRLYARVTGYQPLPSQWRATARVEAGQVFARDAVSIPDPLLFRAGGDDSVRGYAYRSIGVDKDGAIIGGRAIATGSIELAHPVSAKLPNLLGAVFVDAGDAAEKFGNLRANVGYGFGVRWLSPVGPLRLDLAYGQKAQRWRMHFSVGITL
ncbi:MAG: BamA/TamA family outer membrane protein [Aquabacterium sp.]